MAPGSRAHRAGPRRLRELQGAHPVAGRFLKAVIAAVALMVFGVARGGGRVDLGVRNEASRRRAIVARDVVAGALAGAVASGGVLAYTSSATSRGAQDWKPVLATGVGVGLLVGLAVGMIQANRHGRDEPARPTSDGLSFHAQHHDRSGIFIAELPQVRF